ncbi:unnamed protein product [Polarella glacialis]|uniref:AB hydrolase-1 domain-containing protein n=1 Tax=Polarella glacialis TaxID=89957 RepID=A0A813GBI2_POLGL|nr:unnamed protein product [Polarella glacialis]
MLVGFFQARAAPCPAEVRQNSYGVQVSPPWPWSQQQPQQPQPQPQQQPQQQQQQPWPPSSGALVESASFHQVANASLAATAVVAAATVSCRLARGRRRRGGWLLGRKADHRSLLTNGSNSNNTNNNKITYNTDNTNNSNNNNTNNSTLCRSSPVEVDQAPLGESADWETTTTNNNKNNNNNPQQQQTQQQTIQSTANTTEFFPATDGSGALFEVVGGAAKKRDKGALGCGEAEGATLLLIHGSYRAAWCWQEHFLEFFREQGFDTYAMSLRGQGRSSTPGQLPSVAGTLETHAADVAASVHSLQGKHRRPVIILGHSFGGLIVQQAVAELLRASQNDNSNNNNNYNSNNNNEVVAAMILMASVPPSGNGGLILRYLFQRPLLAFRITYGFVTRAFERDEALCRELFFDPDTSSLDVQRYMGLMQGGCPAGTRLLDLRELQKSLPVPGTKPGRLPVLVMGGSIDAIVDAESLRETAEAHATEAVIVEGVAHDSMLGPRWRQSAERVRAWIQELQQQQQSQKQQQQQQQY